MSITLLITAICISGITFICVTRTLKECSLFGFPRMLGVLISALVLMSILSLGEHWTSMLLIPAAAIGLSLGAASLLRSTPCSRTKGKKKAFDRHKSRDGLWQGL